MILCHCLLFFKKIDNLDRGYSNLLQRKSQGESGDSGEDEEPQSSRVFDEKWGWIANVDAVSETCRCSWDDVWNMTAIEFLNILCYRNDKLEEQKAQIEKWKKLH